VPGGAGGVTRGDLTETGAPGILLVGASSSERVASGFRASSERMVLLQRLFAAADQGERIAAGPGLAWGMAGGPGLARNG